MQMTMWLVSCSIGRLMVALFEPLGVRHRKQWNNDVQFQIDFQTNQKEKMLEGFQSSPLQKKIQSSNRYNVGKTLQTIKGSQIPIRTIQLYLNNSIKMKKKGKQLETLFCLGEKQTILIQSTAKQQQKNNTKVRFRCKKGQM